MIRGKAEYLISRVILGSYSGYTRDIHGISPNQTGRCCIGNQSLSYFKLEAS